MLDRFKNLVKGVVNKGMKQMETPEVLAAEAQEQLETSVKEIREAVTKAIANEKILEQQIKKNAEELAIWEKRAATAVQQNNDDLAKQCLLKKRDLNEQGQGLNGQLTDQKETTANLKARYAELDGKLKEFMAKQGSMLQRAKAGEAVAKANELLSGSSGSGMDKWEQKVIENEAKAAALREMSGTPVEDKLKALDEHSQVEDDLAALKAQMGQVKLVVDKEKTRTVVDPNVPMVLDEDLDNLPIDVEEIKDDDDKK